MAKNTECPHCLNHGTKVLATRYSKKLRVTKRECLCLHCGTNFDTAEVAMPRYKYLLQVEALYDSIKTVIATEGTPI
jgi:transcriptional regulator NrdR family protein